MNITRIIFLILVILWMALVFKFSSEKSDKSSNTSGSVIKVFLNVFTSTKKLDDNAKIKLIEKYEPLIRKLAHFSLYTLGGILIMGLVNTYDIEIKLKIIYSFLFGALYACSDELHQFFVEGRSCEFRDVCIDSSGVFLGIMIVLFISKIIYVFNQ